VARIQLCSARPARMILSPAPERSSRPVNVDFDELDRISASRPSGAPCGRRSFSARPRDRSPPRRCAAGQPRPSAPPSVLARRGYLIRYRSHAWGAYWPTGSSAQPCAAREAGAQQHRRGCPRGDPRPIRRTTRSAPYPRGTSEAFTPANPRVPDHSKPFMIGRKIAMALRCSCDRSAVALGVVVDSKLPPWHLPANPMRPISATRARRF
jgi:hypothetical protein